MKVIRGVGVAAVLGAVFGAATSLINDLSSSYGELGSRLVRERWTWVTDVAEVGSLLLDVGWAWAAVAVAAGWLAGGGVIGRGAAVGAVSLVAATAAYFVTDSLLRAESLAGYVGEARAPGACMIRSAVRRCCRQNRTSPGPAFAEVPPRNLPTLCRRMCSRVSVQALFEQVVERVPAFVQRFDRVISRVTQPLPLLDSRLVIERDAIWKQLVGAEWHPAKPLRPGFDHVD